MTEPPDTAFCHDCGNEIRGTPNIVAEAYICNKCFMERLDPKDDIDIDDDDYEWESADE